MDYPERAHRGQLTWRAATSSPILIASRWTRRRQELGYTIRTVWRDLDVLQKASFPIYADRDGRRPLHPPRRTRAS